MAMSWTRSRLWASASGPPGATTSNFNFCETESGDKKAVRVLGARYNDVQNDCSCAIAEMDPANHLLSVSFAEMHITPEKSWLTEMESLSVSQNFIWRGLVRVLNVGWVRTLLPVQKKILAQSTGNFFGTGILGTMGREICGKKFTSPALRRKIIGSGGSTLGVPQGSKIEIWTSTAGVPWTKVSPRAYKAHVPGMCVWGVSTGSRCCL